MRGLALVLPIFLVACSSDDSSSKSTSTGGTGGTSSGGSTSGGGTSSGGTGGSNTGGAAGSSTGGSAGIGPGSCDAWINAHFAGAPVVTGDYDTRTDVETPALVKDATGCCAKYSFDVTEEEAPDDPQVGFVNVTISNLESSDAFGGGIMSGAAPGLVLYLANVQIEPNWPNWIDYDTTNKDGMVLDDASAIYACDLTIKNWHADGAIDNKAPVSQFVRLTLEGSGNRGIRYWEPGPHYIVDSNLNNGGELGEGSLLWFDDCSGAVVKIYNSTFNGASTLDEQQDISCDNGSSPTIEYLTTDPRTTGEMHEMFSP
jgi:hypothetical protein